MIADSWEKTGATKTKPKKQRKPEEIWYDIHKHPEGISGGMGKSPEHHLRNRGWRGHEINESAGRKTIQYRNSDHPDFVISYGGGSSTKPDHNFRVMYMGTNPHIPKVNSVYSVADAMNKVDELHALHNGMVVMPMTHGAGVAPPVRTTKQLKEEVTPGRPKKFQDMTKDDYYPIGDPADLNGGRQYPTKPDSEEDWYQLKEIEPTRKTRPKALAFERARSETWEEA